MAEIRKGKISSFTTDKDANNNVTKAKVIASTSASVSRPLVIPFYLRGISGNLEVGTEVVYAIFEDMTGIIVSRADGEWYGYIHGDIEVENQIKAASALINGQNIGGS